MLSHSAELMLQSLSPVLVLYDPFGVDVPLNCDTTTITTSMHFCSREEMKRIEKMGNNVFVSAFKETNASSGYIAQIAIRKMTMPLKQLTPAAVL